MTVGTFYMLVVGLVAKLTFSRQVIICIVSAILQHDWNDLNISTQSVLFSVLLLLI